MSTSDPRDKNLGVRGEAGSVIDVWDVKTYDPALTKILRNERKLIKSYFDVDNAIEFKQATSGLHPLKRSNQHAPMFHQFINMINEEMASRKIRAWHYTRLSEFEVEKLRTEGIHVSTVETLRRRLNGQIAAGNISQATADVIFELSPFNYNKSDRRQNMFWLASHPLPTDDRGVKPLLTHWGGESVYWYHKTNSEIGMLLSKIGTSRVLEIAVPLNRTERTFWAATSIVANFGQSLGCKVDKGKFDLYVVHPLDAGSIINILSKGEPNFNDLGQGYPPRTIGKDYREGLL
jgi:hypothetical protein